MTEPKLVFSGPPGAGKTTAIAALSDIPPIVTDVRNSDASLAKTHTTVGMDYGEVKLAGDERVRLFGTPGQERFAFMWRILARNAMGLVLLLDNSRPDPRADLRLYLQAFGDLLRDTPCVIGVGRLDTHPEPSLDALADELDQLGWVFPLLAVDVRQREDVLLLVDTALAQLEARQWQDTQP